MKRLATLMYVSILTMGILAQNTSITNLNDLEVNVRNVMFVMKFVGNNTTIITLESQEDGAKASWTLFYNKFGRCISVTANDNKYNKLLLQKKIK